MGLVFGCVLDLEEDTDVGSARIGVRLADQVLAVLDVVDVQRTGEKHVVLERAECDRLAFHDAFLFLFTAAAGRKGKRGNRYEEQEDKNPVLHETVHRR